MTPGDFSLHGLRPRGCNFASTGFAHLRVSHHLYPLESGPRPGFEAVGVVVGVEHDDLLHCRKFGEHAGELCELYRVLDNDEPAAGEIEDVAQLPRHAVVAAGDVGRAE